MDITCSNARRQNVETMINFLIVLEIVYVTKCGAHDKFQTEIIHNSCIMIMRNQVIPELCYRTGQPSLPKCLIIYYILLLNITHLYIFNNNVVLIHARLNIPLLYFSSCCIIFL